MNQNWKAQSRIVLWTANDSSSRDGQAKRVDGNACAVGIRQATRFLRRAEIEIY